MKFRGFVAAGSALTIGLLAAACGSSSSSSSSSSPATSAAAPAASTTAPAPAASTAAAGIKVGLVTDKSGLADKSFNFLAGQALDQAKTELGATGDVAISNSNTDYVPNLQKFASGGYDLVVAVGFDMAQALGDVAKQFPNVKFAIVDDSVAGEKSLAGLTNVEGLLYKEQEAGYLVGYLAGLLEKDSVLPGLTKDKQVISSVGGIKIPPVDRYIAGYQAGAKAADPGITVLNGYSNDFVATDKCLGVANQQIAQGSDIVFQVAGNCGLGALQAAKEKGVWGIGVDTDQSAVNDRIIASATKGVQASVFQTIKDVQAGAFKGGTDVVLGAAQDGAGIAGINAAVPADIKAKVDAVLADIKAGKIQIPDTVK